MTDLMPRRAAGIEERVVLWQPKTVTSSRWELWGLRGGWGEGSCHFLERSLRDESDFRLGWHSRRGNVGGMASEDDGETVAIQQQQDARTRLRGSRGRGGHVGGKSGKHARIN